MGLTPIQLARFLGHDQCAHLLGDSHDHRIKVVDSKTRHIVALTPDQFREQFSVAYLPHLRATYPQLHQLYNACLHDRKVGFFNGQRRWLAALHDPEIRQGDTADLVIQHTGHKLGYGLFAGRDYRSGEYLGLYTGHLTQRAFLRQNANDYCFRMPASRWQLRPLMVDAKLGGNEMRFINHSDEPNVESIGIPYGGIVQILYRTSTSLKRGDQLFCDYGLHAWSKRGLTPVP